MRQIAQPEGSNICGPVCVEMMLDHMGISSNRTKIVGRVAETMKTESDLPNGANPSSMADAILSFASVDVLHTQFGFPLGHTERGYWARCHDSRESRVATWYAVHALLSQGWVGSATIERDTGKRHWVCVDDAFMRAQERWFSVWCPIRGHYEEHAERFLLAPSGEGTGDDWVFIRKRPSRLASAAEVSGRALEGMSEDA